MLIENLYNTYGELTQVKDYSNSVETIYQNSFDEYDRLKEAKYNQNNKEIKVSNNYDEYENVFWTLGGRIRLQA